MKIVIAERDNHERVAIEWLISTYSIPINNVFVAGTVKETMALLEKELPEILYLELDMIPAENWAQIHRYVKSYSPKIIAVTAEATFERAKQAIELGIVDLLVKPLDPVKIRQCLKMAHSLVAHHKNVHVFSPHQDEGYSYRTLFLDEELNNGDMALLVLRAESNNKLADLLQFLTYFPFREQPTVLPLTDMVVCLFKNQTQHLREEAWKILSEWEALSADPLVAVLIPANNKMKTVHEMYLAARRLLEIPFFIGYRQVILPKEEYECWYEMDPFLTSAEQREWVDMLNSFDKQKIKQWMHQEFLHMETPFPNPETLRTRLTSILAQVRRFMKTYQLDHGETEEYYMRIFSEILYNRVLYRIVQEMLLFLYELLDRSKISELFSKKDVIERGILYIEKHYMDPNLTLESVAEAVGRSTAYYSHLLMKKQGISFRQLLANKRMNEAKRLLQASQLTIKEISHQVGFRNPSYFTRLFKEMTSLAPRDYRLQMRKGNESSLTDKS
ncbi:helix-turn-helix domain-containing protein [Halalkalibacter alkaliphilus]|uniref:DNA-binding response regulator n=1 Tax=Halalkalibacter alkaliphilus TaxID=2917993 RepID=A0A9X2CV08_9BACI|nr:helix-turn-helix domain-containing protein [Halalkalibacter alkaliphilus]MCL7748783.1 DNA-binding response regulator [Halalkalibacter alkaliphilus]